MTAKQKRWIKSLVDTARKTETKLPYQRGQRTEVAARLRAAAKRQAA
ncbi:hypothetical protein [Pseudooceanicola sp.]